MRISDWSSDVCSSDLNSAQSLLSEPSDSGISGFAAAPALECETKSASVPTPVPAAAFASFSSSPPPPPPPAPAPSAQPNSPPTALTLDNASVDEGSEGAVVGTLTVVDPDNSESFTYAVSDDRFEVVGGQLSQRDGDRKSVGSGKSGSVRVDHGGRRIMKQKRK